MARIGIITDPDTVLGFRLAGVDAYSASSHRQAEDCIKRFLKNREYEIIAYSDEYSEYLPESLRRKIEESILPIFISIPSVKSWKEGGREEEYIERVLQRALGFYVKIRR